MGAIDSLPTEYGYVVCVLVLYFFVNFYMSIQVGAARKKYKVYYPTLYALESENKDAKLFNCVQRGHQNALENMPIFFLFLSLGGIKHPIIASSFGLLYTVARFFYFQGYSTGQPDNRVKFSAVGFLATFALVGCSISLAVHLLI
ncbi:Microsomal glutathione s-transferase [Thalictrum thalictroides]|uniref:Glutathione S-transferase 3, mitochondrial n=1 Tax=Thalictrum thalictroides TaxID=46969 RepID=A0A7J6VN21_THATH|nr:Microsomal glutathione s-transferase [Thalictrum thalictroides]